MEAGFHRRLTGSCSAYGNNHYYHKSEGLHLRKGPGSVVPPSLWRLGMATDGAREWGVGRGGAERPGGCSQLMCTGSRAGLQGPQLSPRTRAMSTCPWDGIGPQRLVVPELSMMLSKPPGLFPVTAMLAQVLLQDFTWASPVPSWPGTLALPPLGNLFQEKDAKLPAPPGLASRSRWSHTEPRLFRA